MIERAKEKGVMMISIAFEGLCVIQYPHRLLSVNQMSMVYLNDFNESIKLINCNMAPVRTHIVHAPCVYTKRCIVVEYISAC